jgi:hypothetical protein
MNTERALGTFFNEINKAIDVSKKPVQDVLNYYLSSSWKSFEAILSTISRAYLSNKAVLSFTPEYLFIALFYTFVFIIIPPLFKGYEYRKSARYIFQ